MNKAALRYQIKGRLRREHATRDVDISIDELDGVITLSGMVANDLERDAVEAVVATVPDIGKVNNLLKPIEGRHFFIAALGSC